MKVYLLCYTENNGQDHIYMVFSSKEKAEYHIKDFPDKEEYWIDEREVDEEVKSE